MMTDDICNRLAECTHTTPAVLERYTWCTSCGSLCIRGLWYRPSFVEALRGGSNEISIARAIREGRRPISER